MLIVDPPPPAGSVNDFIHSSPLYRIVETFVSTLIESMLTSLPHASRVYSYSLSPDVISPLFE